MRGTLIKWVSMVAVGGILTGTALMGLSASLSTLEPSKGETMSLGQWQAERASQGEEDEAGWDCRVQGNATCGDTWYELVCPAGEQTAATLCTLEAHSVTATPNE